MKEDIVIHFLEEYTRGNGKDNKGNAYEGVLKDFFKACTKMILEKDIMVLLVDRDFKIKNLFSNDEKTHGNFINKTLILEEYPIEEETLNYNLHNHKIYVTLSPLFTYEKLINYRIIMISLKQEDKYKTIINRLNNALNSLLKNYFNTFSAYENLKSYLDAVDEGISACDNNGIIRFINKSGCKMIKAKRQDLIGRKLKEVTTSDAILNQVMENKRTYMDREYYFEYNGKTFHLMNSAYPVYDKNKNFIGAVDIFRRIKRSMKMAADIAGHGAYYHFENFIGSSKALYDSIELARKFSQSNKNVLIIGESGTGKELFAQAIHNSSKRRNGPFVAINCASFPNDLFDSELFGYDEGAFTGAKKGGKIGKFELADGGTLFLDEIGEMPIHLQAKLLRVLETRSLSRIGSNKKVDINLRIIAATNKNLEEMVKNNNFREDLYYRLKVLYLPISPLAKRDEDIIELTNHFIHKYSKDGDKNIKGISERAKDLLKIYPWPGNIRELENIIALSLFYCDGEYIEKEDLLKAGLKNDQSTILANTEDPSKLSEITKDIILQTLEKTGGNKRKAANILGISRNTIYRTLKKNNKP